MKKNLFLIIMIFLLALVGCNRPVVLTPADEFRMKNPELSDKYVELNPTSIKAIRDMIMFGYSSQMTLADNLKNMFPNSDKLIAYLNDMEKREDQFTKARIKKLEEFKKTLTKQDYLYDYVYKDGEIEETGTIVIHNGKIKSKQIFTTTQP
jgi:hypothetical protein